MQRCCGIVEVWKFTVENYGFMHVGLSIMQGGLRFAARLMFLVLWKGSAASVSWGSTRQRGGSCVFNLVVGSWWVTS